MFICKKVGVDIYFGRMATVLAAKNSINLHYGKVKFVPKNPEDTDYVLLITDHRKKDTVFIFSTKLNTETMPEIFKYGMQQAMENNSKNKECMTGARGEYSEYATAVNMKKIGGLEPEDQELCDSTTIVTSVMCNEFDKWLASVCIAENKTIFYTEEESRLIPKINHILVIRRKKTEDEEEDNDESEEYEEVDYDSDYNYTFK